MRVASLLGLTLTLAGCSLDLDRLRARDVGLEPDARTSPLDAALDATVDPSLDAAQRDAAPDDAAAYDTLGILGMHTTGMIDAFAAGRDGRGAWLVTGARRVLVADVTRTDCSALIGENRAASASGKALAAGDLDDDGDLDVIAADGDAFVVIRPDSDGALELSGPIDRTAGGAVTAIEIGDVDHDGVLDVSLFGSMRDMDVFTQSPEGVLSPGPVIQAAPTDATILDGAVVDLDGDGIADIARLLQRAIPSGSSHQVLFGIGDGSFRTPEYDAVGRTTRLRATRGEATLASGTNDEHFVTDRGGTTLRDLPPTMRVVRDMAFAQVHGDTVDELVVVYEGGVTTVYDISSDGEITEWHSAELDPTDTSSEALVVLDVDGDGFDELFVRNGLAIAILGLRPSDCP